MGNLPEERATIAHPLRSVSLATQTRYLHRQSLHWYRCSLRLLKAQNILYTDRIYLAWVSSSGNKFGPSNRRDGEEKAQNNSIDDYSASEKRNNRNFTREFEIRRDIMTAMMSAVTEEQKARDWQIDSLCQSFEERIQSIECYDDDEPKEDIFDFAGHFFVKCIRHQSTKYLKYYILKVLRCVLCLPHNASSPYRSSFGLNYHRFQSVPTPGHFLVGSHLLNLAPTEVIDDVSLTDRLEHQGQTISTFWRLWKANYLSQLNSRSKWRSQEDFIKIGDVVLLKDKSPTLL